MHRPQEMVREFHRLIEQPTSPAPAELRNAELRARLILEEALETAAALIGPVAARSIAIGMTAEPKFARIEPSVIEAIDGCCDVLVVTYGTLETIGVDGEPFFDEVHRTNMLKANGPIDEHGKRLKPPGWEPPRIAELLDGHARLLGGGR